MYENDSRIVCPGCGEYTLKDTTGGERYVVDEARVKDLALKVVRSQAFGANETIFSVHDPDVGSKVAAYFRKYLPKVHEREYFCHTCGQRFWLEVDVDDMVSETIDTCDNYVYRDPRTLNSDDSGDFYESEFADLVESL